MNKLTQNEKGNETNNNVTLRCRFQDKEKAFEQFSKILYLCLSTYKNNRIIELKALSSIFAFDDKLTFDTTKYPNIDDFLFTFESLNKHWKVGLIKISHKTDVDEEIVIKYDFDYGVFEIELKMFIHLLELITTHALRQSEFKFGTLTYHLKSREQHTFMLSAWGSCYRPELTIREKYIKSDSEDGIDEETFNVLNKCNLYRNYNNIEGIKIELEKKQESIYVPYTIDISFKIEVVEA